MHTQMNIPYTLRACVGMLKQWDKMGQWDRCRKIKASRSQNVVHY